MTMAYITKADIKRGKKMLAKALEKARQMASEMPEASATGTGLVPTSQAGAALHSHIRVENLQSLVLREEVEGWFVDFVLKAVPDGCDRYPFDMEHGHGDLTASYSFYTDWVPPEPIVKTLRARFPKLTFTAFFDEPGLQITGFY